MSRLHAQKSLPREDWCTPVEEVVDRVHKVGPVAFDPASNPHSRVRAATVVYLPKYKSEPAPYQTGQVLVGSGLELPWSQQTGHLNFFNPPYGRAHNRVWAARAHHEATQRGCNIIGLVPGSQECNWFDYYWEAAALCFVRGRLRFLGAPSVAPFSSVIPCFTSDGALLRRFVETFQSLGRVVPGARAQYSGSTLVTRTR